MYIIRDGKKYFLTPNEVEEAYREQLHRNLLQEAEAHFYDVICVNPENINENGELLDSEEARRFEDNYGFSFDTAVNDSSEHYLLSLFVEKYENCRDCNVPENDMWETVISDVLNEITVRK